MLHAGLSGLSGREKNKLHLQMYVKPNHKMWIRYFYAPTSKLGCHLFLPCPYGHKYICHIIFCWINLGTPSLEWFEIWYAASAWWVLSLKKLFSSFFCHLCQTSEQFFMRNNLNWVCSISLMGSTMHIFLTQFHHFLSNKSWSTFIGTTCIWNRFSGLYCLQCHLITFVVLTYGAAINE